MAVQLSRAKTRGSGSSRRWSCRYLTLLSLLVATDVTASHQAVLWTQQTGRTRCLDPSLPAFSLENDLPVAEPEVLRRSSSFRLMVGVVSVSGLSARAHLSTVSKTAVPEPRVLPGVSEAGCGDHHPVMNDDEQRWLTSSSRPAANDSGSGN